MTENKQLLEKNTLATIDRIRVSRRLQKKSCGSASADWRPCATSAWRSGSVISCKTRHLINKLHVTTLARAMAGQQCAF